MDLRTKEGRRQEILEQVAEDGGFSIFWITENQLRAKVGEEMVKKGELVEISRRFPYYRMEIK